MHRVCLHYFFSKIETIRELLHKSRIMSDKPHETITFHQKITDSGAVARWNFIRRMSPARKIGLLIYGLLASGTFCSHTYNDGKQALVKRRLSRISKGQETEPDDQEWLVVKEACSENMWDNFWCATFFPASMISNMFPSLVLWWNRGGR